MQRNHTQILIDDTMHFLTKNLERFLQGEPLRNVAKK